MRVVALAVLAFLGASVLAGCASVPSGGSSSSPVPLPPVVAEADPMAAGTMHVRDADYDLGAMTVGGPDANHTKYSYESRVRGHIWSPDGAGPFPLLVFLHGQHQTCGMAGRESFATVDDCSDDQGVNTAYRNDLGYAYLGQDLAARGYVVASILAYEINARNGQPDVGMWARGELILGTIDRLLGNWTGPDLHIDRARVGIMGHSRGGEGVVTAVAVNQGRPAAQRVPLGAVVALAPTDFNGRGVADVPFLALVPYCDGDVYNLHGLRTYDHGVAGSHATSAVHVQVLAMGADHNFYNTMWGDTVAGPVAKGDDAPPGSHRDVTCDLSRETGVGGRMTPDDQRREALLHIGGFFRWVLGHESGLGPYFTGAAPTPAAACPGGTAPCLDAFHVSFDTAAAVRLWDAGGNGTAPAATGFTGTRACSFSQCEASMYSSAKALELTWTQASSLAFRAPAAAPPRVAPGDGVLSFRIGVSPQAMATGQSPPQVTLKVRGADGADATWPSDVHAVYVPPNRILGGSVASVGDAKVALNMVRAKVPSGFDTSRLGSVELDLAPAAAGHVYVTDLLLQDEHRVWLHPEGSPLPASPATGQDRP